MPKQITQYSLLISCPSDVLEELDIIKDVIEEFNRTVGEANNALIVPKHWSTNSYPESGGKAQELLNKQFVLECDLAVAVFWTRFGTPTGNYGSGTEEEIEELIKSGKQVFLYFSDCPINPSTFDQEQYNKVQEFREKYKEGKGLYASYSDLSSFRRNFSNHLYQYFLKLFTEENNILETKTTSSNIAITGIFNGKIIEKPLVFKMNLQNSRFIANLKFDINKLYKKVLKIHIPDSNRTNNDDVEKYDNEVNTDENNTIATLGSYKQSVELAKFFQPIEVSFSDSEKNLISNYANDNNILIDENEFFNIGNLSRVKQLFGGGPMGTGPSTSLEGTEEEKQKYYLIEELINKITEFNQWKKYFNEIDSHYYIELAVSNKGTKFDEDVDIKLFIMENCLIHKNRLPFPDNDILEVAEGVFNQIYRSKKTVAINEYEDYIDYEPINMSYPRIYGPTYEEMVESNKENYKDTVDKIFCYEYFKEDGYDIISFNISYIKQNTNIAFPSLLVFNTMVDEIKYEIRSKHSPKLVEGTLKIDKSQISKPLV